MEIPNSKSGPRKTEPTSPEVKSKYPNLQIRIVRWDRLDSSRRCNLTENRLKSSWETICIKPEEWLGSKRKDGLNQVGQRLESGGCRLDSRRVPT